MFWEGIYHIEKGRLFAAFVKALLRASIIIAIFCVCVVLRHCMSHFIVGRAQMCAANGLLKGESTILIR